MASAHILARAWVGAAARPRVWATGVWKRKRRLGELGLAEGRGGREMNRGRRARRRGLERLGRGREEE